MSLQPRRRSSTVQCVQARRVGRNMALRFMERPSGWVDGRKKIEVCQSRPPNCFLLSSRFLGFWRRGLRCQLGCQLCLFLRSELLLDLEADRVHIHLVRGRCITKYLCGVLPGGCVENGDLYQQTAQSSFFGVAQIGCKQLPDRVAVLCLLDAALTGDDLQTAVVQQCSKPLDHKKQIALWSAEGRQHYHSAKQVCRNPAGEAQDERGGDPARVQDVQVHHRSHCLRRQRKGRTEKGLHSSGLPGSSPQEAVHRARSQRKRRRAEAPP